MLQDQMHPKSICLPAFLYHLFIFQHIMLRNQCIHHCYPDASLHFSLLGYLTLLIIQSGASLGGFFLSGLSWSLSRRGFLLCGGHLSDRLAAVITPALLGFSHWIVMRLLALINPPFLVSHRVIANRQGPVISPALCSGRYGVIADRLRAVIPPGICRSSYRVIVLLGVLFLGTTVLMLRGKGQV